MRHRSSKVPKEPSSLGRFQRGSSWLAAGEFASASGAVVATALFARGLSQESFGTFAVVLAMVNVVAGLVNVQPWQLVTVEGPQARLKPGDGWASMVRFSWRLDVFTSLLGFAVAVGVGAVAGRFSDPRYFGAGLVYSLAVLSNFVSVPQALLRLDSSYRTLARIAALTGGARAAAGFAFLAFEPTLLTATVLWTAAEMAQHGQLLVIWHRHYRKGVANASPVPRQERSRWFRFVVVTNLHSTTKLAVTQGDVLIVNGVAGIGAAATYKIVKQVAAAVSRAVSPIAQAVFPEMSTAMAAGTATKQLRRRAGLIAIVPPLLAIAVLPIFGAELYGVAFGGYRNAVQPSMIYLIGVVIAAATVSWHPAMLSFSRERESFRIVVIATLLYLTLLPFLTYIHGLSGAAWSFVGFYVLWALLMHRALKRELNRLDAR